MSVKTILIYGASGGLGSSISRFFYNKGHKIILAGRNKDRLKRLRGEISGEIRAFSITEDIDEEVFKGVDIVINTTGVDTRKALEKQGQKEIRDQIEINLYGVINLTKAALDHFKKRGRGKILHLGGFSDGSWATPYYSVDVATRSGIYSFIKSLNLELNNRSLLVQYFCPLPADTEAEKKYHRLWKSLGVKVVSREMVAREVYKAVEKGREITIMGGFINNFVTTKLKYLFPGLIHKTLLKPMGLKTMKYIDNMEGNR